MLPAVAGADHSARPDRTRPGPGKGRSALWSTAGAEKHSGASPPRRAVTRTCEPPEHRAGSRVKRTGSRTAPPAAGNPTSSPTARCDASPAARLSAGPISRRDASPRPHASRSASRASRPRPSWLPASSPTAWRLSSSRAPARGRLPRERLLHGRGLAERADAALQVRHLSLQAGELGPNLLLHRLQQLLGSSLTAVEEVLQPFVELPGLVLRAPRHLRGRTTQAVDGVFDDLCGLLDFGHRSLRGVGRLSLCSAYEQGVQEEHEDRTRAPAHAQRRSRNGTRHSPARRTRRTRAERPAGPAAPAAPAEDLGLWNTGRAAGRR